MIDRKKRIVVYILGFLVGFHIALPAYITSSFLSTVLPVSTVGIIYSVGSIFTIIAFSIMPNMLKKYGAFKTAVFLLFIEFAAMLTLAVATSPAIIVTAQVASIISIALLFLPLDVFLEHYSKDSTTGGIRGTYLVAMNGAMVVGQIFLAVFLSDSGYRMVFSTTSLVLIPILIIIGKNFKHFHDNEYPEINPLASVSLAMKNKNVSGILIINFLLQFFYAWMIIYTPIYLHEYVGFDWKEIGFMFGVMLLPFVLMEYPLGRIADSWLGEKELLVGGFLILAIMSSVMGMLVTPSVVIWTIVLFTSRIGASMVESMSETYFFKQVKDSDIGFMGLFRTTRPWAYVIAPAVATIMLPIAGIANSFFILGLIMLYGIRFSFSLQDTK